MNYNTKKCILEGFEPKKLSIPELPTKKCIFIKIIKFLNQIRGKKHVKKSIFIIIYKVVKEEI